MNTADFASSVVKPGKEYKKALDNSAKAAGVAIGLGITMAAYNEITQEPNTGINAFLGISIGAAAGWAARKLGKATTIYGETKEFASELTMALQNHPYEAGWRGMFSPFENNPIEVLPDEKKLYLSNSNSARTDRLSKKKLLHALAVEDDFYLDTVLETYKPANRRFASNKLTPRCVFPKKFFAEAIGCNTSPEIIPDHIGNPNTNDTNQLYFDFRRV